MMYELLAVVFAIGVLLWLMQRTKLPKNYPKGPPGWPFIGNLFQLGPAVPLRMTQYSKQYGAVYSLKLLDKNIVVLNTYKVLHEAMIEKKSDFAGRPPHLTWNILSGLRSVTFQDYSAAFKMKRRLTMNGLRLFGTQKWTAIVTEEVEKLIDSFTQKSSSSFDPHWLIHLAAFNVVCRLAVGRSYTNDDPEFLEYISMTNAQVKELDGGLALDYANWLTPFYSRKLKKLREIGTVRSQFMENKMKHHMATLDRDKPRDLIDIVLIAKENLEKNPTPGLKVDDVFSYSDQVQFAMGVITPGSETVVSAIKWLLVELCLHPEVQKKLHRELDEVVGPDRKPVYSDREHLPFLQSAIYENMRLYSVEPLAIMHRTIRDTTVDGYQIPSDTYVIANLWAIDHDDGVFEDPHSFKADRFINPNTGCCMAYKEMNFAPFGLGQRACLGEAIGRIEYFLIAANLMHEFSFSFPTGQEKPRANFGMTTFPEPFEILVKKRSKEA
ncbi:steroid 17-alpha-hydroxylase/17,20 lyase-like [Glandiceps talaboti]